MIWLVHDFWPVIVQVLEGDNAVQKNREIMGNTDPAKAEEGPLEIYMVIPLKLIPFMDRIQLENAKIEIDIFLMKMKNSIFNNESFRL